jgi:hypothetical protein
VRPERVAFVHNDAELTTLGQLNHCEPTIDPRGDPRVAEPRDDELRGEVVVRERDGRVRHDPAA